MAGRGMDASKAQRQTAPALPGIPRRDVLWLAVGGLAAAAAAQWPHAGRDELLDADIVEIDLAPIEVGSSVTVRWRGERVTIRRRTAKEIAAARAVPLVELRDPQSDEDRIKPGRDEWLVVVARCTHKGCRPVGEAGDFGGWFCPGHGSTYDTAGRVRSGPAPRNLAVPPYEFVGESIIRIG